MPSLPPPAPAFRHEAGRAAGRTRTDGDANERRKEAGLPPRTNQRSSVSPGRTKSAAPHQRFARPAKIIYA